MALLELMHRRPLSAPDLIGSHPKIAGLPASEALALAQALNWLHIEAGGVVLTLSPAGMRLLECDCYEIALRRIVLDHAELQTPDWLQNATYGRSRVLGFCPPGIRQVLVEAEVAGEPTSDVVDFWDALASLARGLQKDQLVAIGREGEQLTLAYEAARTGGKPRWVAIDSNQDGYDVLSIKASDDPSLLSIEVKASRMGLKGDLHLTRHEWDIALERPAHVFHLWDLASRPARLATVGIDEMAVHLPQDTGAGGWEVVEIPFEAFKDLFSLPT